jgi:hypothetical protein
MRAYMLRMRIKEDNFREVTIEIRKILGEVKVLMHGRRWRSSGSLTDDESYLDNFTVH